MSDFCLSVSFLESSHSAYQINGNEAKNTYYSQIKCDIIIESK